MSTSENLSTPQAPNLDLTPNVYCGPDSPVALLEKTQQARDFQWAIQTLRACDVQTIEFSESGSGDSGDGMHFNSITCGPKTWAQFVSQGLSIYDLARSDKHPEAARAIEILLNCFDELAYDHVDQNFNDDGGQVTVTLDLQTMDCTISNTDYFSSFEQRPTSHHALGVNLSDLFDNPKEVFSKLLGYRTDESGLSISSDEIDFYGPIFDEQATAPDGLKEALIALFSLPRTDPIVVHFSGGGDSGGVDQTPSYPKGLSQEHQSTLNEFIENQIDLVDWDWYNNEGGSCNLELNLSDKMDLVLTVSGGYYENDSELRKELEGKVCIHNEQVVFIPNQSHDDAGGENGLEEDSDDSDNSSSGPSI